MNEIQIKVTAGPAGNLIGQIKAATDAAKAAAGDVPIKLTVDTQGTAAQVAAAMTDAKQAASAAGAAELKFHATVDQGGFISDLNRVFASGDLGTANASGKDYGLAILAGIRGAFAGGGGGTGFWGGIGTFLATPGALGLSAALIAPFATSLEDLTGILPVAGAGIVGLATAGATLKIAFNDVTPAIQAYYAAQDATRGKDAQLAAQQLSTANSIISSNIAVANAQQALTDANRTSTDSMITANEALKSSQQSLDDAQRNSLASMITARQALASAVQSEGNAERTAADSMRSALETQARAEDTLTAAQQSELRAQLNLTDARTAAQRTIEDLNNKVIDEAISQRQATEDLENAQIALNKARSGQGGDPEAAATALDAARQRVNEVGLAYQRAQDDAAKANAAGVDGAKSVVSAQDSLVAAQNATKNAAQAVADADTKVSETQITNAQNVASAKQKVADAQRSLTNLEISTNQQIADAQQKVGDSQRALDNTRITSAEAVVHAQQAVDAALRSQAQAVAQQKASLESAAGSLALYNKMLADLPGNAQDVVRAIVGLQDYWEGLQHTVQQHLFAGVGDEIRTIGATVLPVVQTGLEKMADSLNKVILAFAGWLTSKQTIADLGTLFGNLADAVAKLAPAIGPIMQIFTDLITVGSSFLPGLAGGFANSAQKAADFVRAARDSGQLKIWMQEGLNSLHDLYLIAKDLITIFKDLSGSAKPGDSSLLHWIADITDKIAWLLDNVKILTPIIEGFIAAWALNKILTPLTALITGVEKTTFVGWALKAALDVIRPALLATWETALGPIGLVILAVGAVAAGAYLIVKNWSTISGFFVWLWGYIEGGWNNFITFMGQVGNIISNIGGWMWNGLVSGAKWAVNGVIMMLNGLIDGINALSHAANAVSFGTIHIPDIPYIPHWLAAGGPAPSGWAMVGEQGPELVRLPGGSQVMPASNTATMLGGNTAPVEVRLVMEWHGSGDLFEVIRNGVRIRGGDVQRALGHS